MSTIDSLALIGAIVVIVVPLAGLIWYIINHRSEWKKIFLAGVVTVLVMAALLVGVNAVASHYAPSTPSPAAVVTPSYEHNLSSTNINLFFNAFALAFREEDVQSIEAHTDTLHFIEYCASGGQPPYSPQGCMNDWQTVKQQIASDKVRFSIPADSSDMTVSNICRQFAGSFDVVSGSYDNAGFTLPLPHFGTAYFIFECVTCGSETTWGWQGVMLC